MNNRNFTKFMKIISSKGFVIAVGIILIVLSGVIGYSIKKPSPVTDAANDIQEEIESATEEVREDQDGFVQGFHYRDLSTLSIGRVAEFNDETNEFTLFHAEHIIDPATLAGVEYDITAEQVDELFGHNGLCLFEFNEEGLHLYTYAEIGLDLERIYIQDYLIQNGQATVIPSSDLEHYIWLNTERDLHDLIPER